MKTYAVTTRIMAAKLSGQYQSWHIAVAAAGKRADGIARRLRIEVMRAPERVLCEPATTARGRDYHIPRAGKHLAETEIRGWRVRPPKPM